MVINWIPQWHNKVACPVRAREFGLAKQIRPTRPASACSFSTHRLNLVLTLRIPPAFCDGDHLSYRQPPSSQSRVYQVTQLRTNAAYCRESASTGPLILKVVPVRGASFSGISTDYDQLMCASLFPHQLLIPVALDLPVLQFFFFAFWRSKSNILLLILQKIAVLLSQPCTCSSDHTWVFWILDPTVRRAFASRVTCSQKSGRSGCSGFTCPETIIVSAPPQDRHRPEFWPRLPGINSNRVSSTSVCNMYVARGLLVARTEL